MAHSEQFVREVALAALADVRTVRRVLRGKRVRGLVGERILKELAARQIRVAAAGGKPA
jgi:hypothetical protein